MLGKTHKGISRFLPKTITLNQAKDTGMAMVLICLLIGIFLDKLLFFSLATGILLINMIWPKFFRPLAILWIALSYFLGTIVSKVLLSIIFFVIVTPVGLTRRILGIDSLQLKKWKKSRSSVFKKRNHIYRPDDINKPF